jgi:pantoate--beta-alanine ligase
MNVETTIASFRTSRAALLEPVGFVPTMGYLHEGHLALVREAKRRGRSVVVSLFVNPSQFSPSEDLAAYPRDLDRDLEFLEAEGVDLVFAPDAPEMYPDGFNTWVTVEELARRLEGAERPTHFRGVATVVAKLFLIVRPQIAVFGQKDAQQALVVRRLVDDLGFEVELVVAPTVREPDGLAMSSRNTYLTPEERSAAPILHRSLLLAQSRYADGVRDASAIRAAMEALIASEPLVRPIYVSIADVKTMRELETIDRKAVVSLAARLGKARLIDNVVLPPGEGLVP